MLIRVQVSQYWQKFLKSPGRLVLPYDAALYRLVSAFSDFCRTHLAGKDFTSWRSLHEALDGWPDFLRARGLPPYAELQLGHYLRAIIARDEMGTIYLGRFSLLDDLCSRSGASQSGCAV